MKKVFKHILLAGMTVLGIASCALREDGAVFKSADGTAPVLTGFDIDEETGNFTATFTPGTIKMGFNEKIAYNHTVALVSVDNKAVSKPVSASISIDEVLGEGTASITAASISKALVALGYEQETSVNVGMTIRATLQSASSDNGINGYLESTGIVDGPVYIFIPKAQGNPWKDFTEESPWSLIGSIASVGMNWDNDILAKADADGKKHVMTKVKLEPTDQFKVRKDQGWDVNRGAPGETEPFVVALDTPIAATANGKNLAVSAAGTYDILYDEEEETITISEAWFSYPGYDEVSPWGVTGSIESRRISWDKDVAMITDGTWHVAEGVELKKTDQFKFRKDQGWDVNLGAPGETEPFVVTLDEEQSAVANGKNLAVPEDGVYDLLCNPDEGLYKIVVSLGGRSLLVGESDDDDDEEEEDKPEAWSLIGTIGGDKWATDIDLSNAMGDIWIVRFVEIAEGEEFKIRADYGWDVAVGGPEANATSTAEPGNPYDVYEPVIGETFEAGGYNIRIPEAGVYDITFDYAAKTILVEEHVAVYSLIGAINGTSWTNDFAMIEKDGVWVSPAVTIAGGFKVRYDYSWDADKTYGAEDGFTPVIGEAFTAVQPGSDIAVAEGDYVVTFNPADNTILIENALPADLWSLIGVNGDWSNDIFMTRLTSGIWVSPVVEFGGEFKLRYNHDWDVNRGGVFSETGARFEVTQGAGNINVPEGKYQIVYNPALETVTVNTAASNWSVIGTYEGYDWNFDLFMTETENQVFESEAFLASGGFKIRYDSGWDVNRGGTFAADGEAFTAVEGGANISVGDNPQLVKVTYNFISEELTVKVAWCLIGQVEGTNWSDDFALTETSEGIWETAATIEGEFKLRKSGGWDVNRGGTLVELGEAFEVTQGGGNIAVPEPGKYRVVYDEAADTVTVTAI